MMSKKYWTMLFEMFETEEGLKEKYKDLADVVAKIKESMRLSEEYDKINKELQELNED